MHDHPCFERGDFDDALPTPGFYPSTIGTARYRVSRSGHRLGLCARETNRKVVCDGLWNEAAGGNGK